MNTYLEGYVGCIVIGCMVYVSNFNYLVIIIVGYFENERYQLQFPHFPKNIMLSRGVFRTLLNSYTMDFFCKNSKRHLAIDYFRKKKIFIDV